MLASSNVPEKRKIRVYCYYCYGKWIRALSKYIKRTQIAILTMDLRLKTPFNAIIAGASQSGKTTFVLNLLRHIDELFLDSRCKNNIIYYYKEMQPNLQSFQSENIVRHWVNKLPTVEDVKDRTLNSKETGGSVIIIDDFASDLTKDISEIFTVIGHHQNTSVILLSQNLFQQGSTFRNVSLNSKYIIIFKNPRDSSQISHFARQFAPNNSKWIVNAFKEATKTPYSYMFLDNHQTTPDVIRVLSNILLHEWPIRVWLEKTI